jgi:hypothetical protein
MISGKALAVYAGQCSINCGVSINTNVSPFILFVARYPDDDDRC